MNTQRCTTEQATVADHRPEPGNSPLGYTVGFVGSLVTTLAAYALVQSHSLPRVLLIASVSGLALIQLLLQLILFLHLGRETKPRWKLLVFIFMVFVVIIVVYGSLWIMTNLNYNMTPHQMTQYLKNQDGL